MKLREIIFGAALLCAPAATGYENGRSGGGKPDIYYFFSPSMPDGELYQQIVDKWDEALGDRVGKITAACTASKDHYDEDIRYCGLKGSNADAWAYFRNRRRYVQADKAAGKHTTFLPAVYVDYGMAGSKDCVVRVTSDSELCSAVGLEKDCLE